MLKPVFAPYGSLDAASIFHQSTNSNYTVTTSVEGGYLGILTGEGVAGQFPKVGVVAYDDVIAANYPMLGLIDDSSTGSGYGTLFGKLAANANDAGGTVLGPSTHYASDRITLWTNEGIFITDEHNITVDSYGEATAAVCGDPLYWSAASSADPSGNWLKWHLTATSSEMSVATFLAIIDDPSDPLMSWVQPIPAGTTFLLFKFKGVVGLV